MQRLIETMGRSTVIVPTVGVWWLFLPEVPWKSRLGGTVWAALFVVLLKHFGATFPAVITAIVAISAISLAACATVYILLMTRPTWIAAGAIAENHSVLSEFEQLTSVPCLTEHSFPDRMGSGEFVLFEEYAAFFEYRPSGISTSQGKSFRGFFSSGASTSRTQTDIREIPVEMSTGNAWLTNRRILFMGDKRTLELGLNRAVLKVVEGKLHVSAPNKRPVLLQLPSPLRWAAWGRCAKDRHLTPDMRVN